MPDIAIHRHKGGDAPRIRYRDLDGKPAHTLELVVFEFATDTATGDGKFYFTVRNELAGQRIKNAYANVITAGTTNTLDIQLANVTQSVDVFSTKLTVDSGETDSSTAATPVVINPLNDQLTLHDVMRIDVDAVHTTAAKGLIVTLETV